MHYLVILILVNGALTLFSTVYNIPSLCFLQGACQERQGKHLQPDVRAAGGVHIRLNSHPASCLWREGINYITMLFSNNSRNYINWTRAYF